MDMISLPMNATQGATLHPGTDLHPGVFANTAHEHGFTHFGKRIHSS